MNNTPVSPQGALGGTQATVDAEAAMNRHQERRMQEVRERRELAHRTIEDMWRLLVGWQNNSLTNGPTTFNGQASYTPLTITLNEQKIEAITLEFRRLDSINRRLQDVTTDWELGQVPPSLGPQVVGAAQGTANIPRRPE